MTDDRDEMGDGAASGGAARWLRRSRYCKGCGYDLFGLPTGDCPECGRGFNPALPSTFLNEPGGGWGVRFAGWSHGWPGRLGWVAAGLAWLLLPRALPWFVDTALGFVAFMAGCAYLLGYPLTIGFAVYCWLRAVSRDGFGTGWFTAACGCGLGVVAVGVQWVVLAWSVGGSVGLSDGVGWLGMALGVASGGLGALLYLRGRV